MSCRVTLPSMASSVRSPQNIIFGKYDVLEALAQEVELVLDAAHQGQQVALRWQWISARRIEQHALLARARDTGRAQGQPERVRPGRRPRQVHAREHAVLPHGLVVRATADLSGARSLLDRLPEPVVDVLGPIHEVHGAVGVAGHGVELDAVAQRLLVVQGRARRGRAGAGLAIGHGHHQVVLELLVMGREKAAPEQPPCPGAPGDDQGQAAARGGVGVVEALDGSPWRPARLRRGVPNEPA
jgi:hypothetical protein